MSELDDFRTVDQLKKELLMLTREHRAAMLTVDKLLKDANLKNEKISQLEALLAQNVPVIKKEKDKVVVSVSAEEEIAQLQLERLRQSAQNRVLTLEEIRAYDLLVKNKRLSLDESTINLGKNSYRDVSDAHLLQLAATEVKPEIADDESDDK